MQDYESIPMRALVFGIALIVHKMYCDALGWAGPRLYWDVSDGLPNARTCLSLWVFCRFEIHKRHHLVQCT
jgi:hypothetical protein